MVLVYVSTLPYIWVMYIRQVKKRNVKNGTVFLQYTLAQTYRIDGKVKQNNILYLGSNPLLDLKENRSIVLAILKSKIFGQTDLFPSKGSKDLVQLALGFYTKYLDKYPDNQNPKAASIPPPAAESEYHNIDIKSLEVAEVRSFGPEHLCKQIADKLHLSQCLKALNWRSVDIQKALISICARAIYTSSEHKTAQILVDNSELLACYNYGSATISHRQLYRISDLLYKNKQAIDQHIYQRVTDMYSLEDNLVIYDLSNSHFEGRKAENKLPKYGRNKQKRNDCKQVVFTGVINKEGFIRHSRIYEGNQADSTTIEDMLDDLKQYTPHQTKATVVIDAGIATEDNLQLIASRGYHYVCVSRKRLTDYPVNAHTKTTKVSTNRDKHEVEITQFQPQGYNDKWLYVHSSSKQLKEASMSEKLMQRFEEDLQQVDKALTKKGGTKKLEKVWERIGRLKEKHKRVASRYKIELRHDNSVATHISWTILELKDKEDKDKGIYFLRTNYETLDDEQFWQIYNTIREVESTFRCLKSDLHIRPIHHQKDHRIEAHIYLTLLAYQIVTCIRHMLKQKELNYDWKNIVRIMKTHTIQTLELPTDKKTIHLRKPSKPSQKVQQIYTATHCTHTLKAIKKYRVTRHELCSVPLKI